MEANGQRRGSVLMEFIIVFPIYLILFAGMVLVGDMLIHSNRLVSADRVAAYRVDGRDSFSSVWQMLAGFRDNVSASVFHPGMEIADDGNNQDFISPSSTAHYADVTGPWSVCALASAHDRYRPLAGGALGQLLSARILVGGGGVGILDQLSGGIDMVSKDARNGASFYTLKRRDHYNQRRMRRVGYDRYIASDYGNWRDREYVSRLLRTQGGPGTENWRLEVANEGWHTAETISGQNVSTSCSEARGANLPAYSRYWEFVNLSQ